MSITIVSAGKREDNPNRLKTTPIREVALASSNQDDKIHKNMQNNVS